MSKFNSHKKAVALKYDESKSAPIIVASGLGYMAEKIVEVANEHNLPVYEDNSLTNVLTQLELGTPIPEELYKAVVDIYVYFINECKLTEIDGILEKDEDEEKQAEDLPF